jgi:hypothetical protein
MASTRNKNTPGNYCMEQWSLGKGSAYITYKDSVVPVHSMYAGDGLIQGRMGNPVLAKNPEDIESALFGIGSTNLVKPKPEVKPELKNLPTLSMIDRIPLILPEVLVVERNQRQYPMK